MAKQDDDLNSHLERAFQKRDDNKRTLPIKADVVEVSHEPSNELTEEYAEEKMGVISRLKLRNAESAHELQKAKTTYETEMELIRHKANAAIRESKAFWDAKSVEVAESIKTYVQSTVRALELNRLDSRNDDLQRAYESAAVALDKAKSSSIPEVMKDRLIQDILANFERTLERIKEDTIVAKYDLD